MGLYMWIGIGLAVFAGIILFYLFVVVQYGNWKLAKKVCQDIRERPHIKFVQLELNVDELYVHHLLEMFKYQQTITITSIEDFRTRSIKAMPENIKIIGGPAGQFKIQALGELISDKMVTEPEQVQIDVTDEIKKKDWGEGWPGNRYPDLILRPEIKEFTQQMEAVMMKHDEAKGDSWKTLNLARLYDKLQEEIKEVEGYYRIVDMGDQTILEYSNELIDVANACMMLRSRLIDKRAGGASTHAESDENSIRGKYALVDEAQGEKLEGSSSHPDPSIDSAAPHPTLQYLKCPKCEGYDIDPVISSNHPFLNVCMECGHRWAEDGILPPRCFRCHKLVDLMKEHVTWLQGTERKNYTRINYPSYPYKCKACGHNGSYEVLNEAVPREDIDKLKARYPLLKVTVPELPPGAKANTVICSPNPAAIKAAIGMAFQLAGRPDHIKIHPADEKAVLVRYKQYADTIPHTYCIWRKDKDKTTLESIEGIPVQLFELDKEAGVVHILPGDKE